MKSNLGLFLLGALVGAAVALGVRAVIVDGEGDGHAAHASHSKMPVEPAPPVVKATGLLLDLGNENCPIMGKPVTGVTWSEWNGLRVGHCCPPCIEDFLAAPEKSLDDAGIKWRKAAATVAAIRAATGEERKQLLAKSDYTVVREE